MRTKDSVVWFVILAIFAGTLAGCGALQPTATPLPTETPPPTATHTPMPSPTPTKGVELPPGSTRLAEERADLDGDGSDEEIVVYRSGQVEGLAVDGWRTELPPERRFHELRVLPIVFGTPPEVLLFADQEDEIYTYLYVYDWDGQEGQLLVPQDGPLAGMDAFRSAYDYPVVEDGDVSGTQEVVVLKVADNPQFLEVLYYEWMEDEFRLSSLFMSMPRAAPSAGN